MDLVMMRKRLQGILKSSACGRWIYPGVQKCWRAYAIPKRRRLLQKHGADVLKRLHEIMVANSISYYCEAGTLLGLMRDGGFIPHDDDVDISIRADTKTPDLVLRALIAHGYRFLHAFEYQGRVTEFTVLDECGLSIDVFFHTKAKTDGYLLAWQPYWSVDKEYPAENANSLVEFEFVAPTKLIPHSVVGVTTMIPENFSDVLKSSYGPWQVPDAHYDTVNDRIHRDLPGYAYRIPESKVYELYERRAGV